MSEPMPRKMTDQRLHEIAESANLRNVVLTQVPSRFDERVKECNDQIGELVDTVLALRFELNHLKAKAEPQPCTPNSSSPAAAPFTALSPTELADLVAAYLVTDEMPADAKGVSEGWLSEMLRATNGMCREEVRALWFDAVERGNRLIERYTSEQNSHRDQSRERPPSGSTGDGA